MLAVIILEVKLSKCIIKKKAETNVQNVEIVIKEAVKSYELLDLCC